MLLITINDLPTILALLLQGDGSGLIHPPTDITSIAKLLLRWAHFVAGIAWIGLLYFFNLVNVPLMKKLDAPTKGKVIPEMMPRALWYFRWGAVITVLVGLAYYAMYILRTDAVNAGLSTWGELGKWLVVVVIAWVIIYALIQQVSWPVGRGPILAVLITIVAVVMSWVVVYLLGSPGMSNKTLSIGIGGGLGIIMLLNVWGIIWPAQKRIIAWTKENAEKLPPEAATLARRAFLASRTNTWLSLPMLFFMAASHDYIWFAQ